MPASNLLLAAKIVVLEEPPQIRNIPGVPTAIAAFSGVTERGPVRTPVFVNSFEEFVDTFGSYTSLSDLPNAIEGFFRNEGTAAWISRVVHYTDITSAATQTAVKGDQQIVDRGGAAAAAVLDSVAGPFQLEPAQDLVVDIDGTGPDTLTLAATQAISPAAGNSEPFALVNLDTFVYRTNSALGSATLGPLRTITFLTADFGTIGAATAQEVVDVINRDGSGISALVVAGPTIEVRSDAQGSAASLVIDAASTSIAVGKLNIASGTTNGSGNVTLIDAVTAAELAGLLTALPLGAGTAVDVAGVLRLTGVTTGIAGTVVITAGTTAVGIFTGALPITQTGSDAAETNTIKVIARDPGAWITTPVLYAIVIEVATSGDADRFNLRVLKGAATEEIWPNLSMDPLDARYVESFILANSTLIDVEDQFSPATPPANLPQLGTFSAWANQDNGLSGLVDVDFTGSQAGGTGLFAFDVVQALTLLAIPGRSTSAVHNAMIQYCEVERVGTCFAVLDPPPGLDEQQIKTYVETTAAIGGLSEFAAIYWPRVKIQNPSTAIFGAADEIVVPPSGHLLGLYARIDASRPGGVYQAPAGVENGILFGVLGFETDDVLDERKRDVVYPARINPITVINNSPRHVDGSRTLKGGGNFPSIPERRGVIFIEESIKQGTLFVKHRNNDRRLRMELKRTIDTFLLRQFENDAFRGDTAQESFFTDVSDALNTIERIFAGEVHARVGLATQKPAEFIILTFTQDTRELEERLATQGLG